MDYRINVSLDEDTEFASYLHHQIREYNNRHSPYHKAAREKGAIKHIQAIVYNTQTQWSGGITAELYWNWLELNDFWLPEEARGQGLGSSLLAQVEQAAREQGAQKVLLTTFEFQARTFYERHGYQVVGVVEDYPPGTNFYTMVKDLYKSNGQQVHQKKQAQDDL